MKTIAIVGCGWLGLPLAEKLINHGYKIIGTTTSKDKLNNLIAKGIDAHILDLDKRDYETSFLNACDIIFLNIPPGLRSNPSGSFIIKLERFLKKLHPTNIKKAVYINSTAVYPSSGIYNETTSFIPDSDKGKELLESEKLICDSFQTTTVIRLGGLFGPNRHPSRFVRSAKQLESNSNANLIHLEDAVNLSFTAIINNEVNIINGVHPHHPDKYSFYKKAYESEGKDFPYPTPDKFTERIIERIASVTAFNFKNELLYHYL